MKSMQLSNVLVLCGVAWLAELFIAIVSLSLAVDNSGIVCGAATLLEDSTVEDVDVGTLG